MTTWIQELDAPHPPSPTSPLAIFVARLRHGIGSALSSLRVAAPLVTVALAAGYIVSARTPSDRAASEFGGPMAAEVLPLLALAGVAIAMWRHRPDLGLDPIRPIAGNVAVASFGGSVALVGVQLLEPGVASHLVGPTISVALMGSYVASWGLRAPALMRTVALLSLLTWNTIATRLDEIVGNTLARPSDMVYRRLAQVPALEIGDEPWRLYTATMHHGSLIVVAIVVLVVAITRQRFTPRLTVDIVVTAGVTLVAHHADRAGVAFG